MQSALSRRGMSEDGADQQSPNPDNIKQTTKAGNSGRGWGGVGVGVIPDLTPPRVPCGAFRIYLNTRPLNQLPGAPGPTSHPNISARRLSQFWEPKSFVFKAAFRVGPFNLTGNKNMTKT